MKKVILKVDLHNDSIKKKAMKAVSGLPGVESVSVDMKNKKLTLTGDIDPVSIGGKLRKLCHTEIVSVGPAEQEKEEKKEEKENKWKDEKKEEKKKENKEDKKKEDRKKDEKKQIIDLVVTALQKLPSFELASGLAKEEKNEEKKEQKKEESPSHS